jgi:predicted nuclease of predicted toxin-antitoxin system
MKFLADESLSQIIVNFLKATNFDIVTAKDLGLAGAEDELILQKSIELKRFVLTSDSDFSDIRFLEEFGPLGVVIIKVYRDAADIKSLKTQLLKGLGEIENMKNILVVVDRNKFRIRKI